MIADGSSDMVEIGDVADAEECTFAGDIIVGMLTLIEQDKVYEAVIGSGQTSTFQYWLKCCSMAIGPDWRGFVLLKEKFTPEYRHLISDPRSMKHLGWSPKIGIGELAEMMVGRWARK